ADSGVPKSKVQTQNIKGLPLLWLRSQTLIPAKIIFYRPADFVARTAVPCSITVGIRDHSLCGPNFRDHSVHLCFVSGFPNCSTRNTAVASSFVDCSRNSCCVTRLQTGVTQLR